MFSIQLPRGRVCYRRLVRPHGVVGWGGRCVPPMVSGLYKVNFVNGCECVYVVRIVPGIRRGWLCVMLGLLMPVECPFEVVALRGRSLSS